MIQLEVVYVISLLRCYVKYHYYLTLDVASEIKNLMPLVYGAMYIYSVTSIKGLI